MVGYDIKNFFFDREKVIRQVDRAKRAALSKSGAFVRRSAKSSIRKRKKVSRPGQPPSSHEGSLRRLIMFGYDPSAGSVVAGPLKFGNTDAPRNLEFGGRTTVTRYRYKHTRSGATDASFRGEDRRGVRRTRERIQVRIRPRPFMGPALEREARRMPQMWRNSVWD